MYCVVAHSISVGSDPARGGGGSDAPARHTQWRLALMTGTRKEPLPESFKSVRAACRAAAALNVALWRVETPQEAA